MHSLSSRKRDAMEIFIKVSPRDYDRLRSQIPTESRAHEAIGKATRIDHALEGVQFEGYNIPCDEDQARIILEIAKRYFPDIIRDIEKAMVLAGLEKR
jgi:hypothetical protein